jgi:hypothetical protein
VAVGYDFSALCVGDDWTLSRLPDRKITRQIAAPEGVATVKVLAVYNIKGGVGKTSTAVNLAYLAARDGYRTLLWDLDPQGSATMMLDAKPRARGGLRSLLRAKKGLQDAICDTEYEGLSVIPADFADRKVEAVLSGERAPRRRITRLLAPLEDEFDLIVFGLLDSLADFRLRCRCRADPETVDFGTLDLICVEHGVGPQEEELFVLLLAVAVGLLCDRATEDDLRTPLAGLNVCRSTHHLTTKFSPLLVSRPVAAGEASSLTGDLKKERIHS